MICFDAETSNAGCLIYDIFRFRHAMKIIFENFTITSEPKVTIFKDFKEGS